MASYENFYGGASYPLSQDFGDNYLDIETRYPASTFGIPTDPRTANQLKAVFDKLSTGAKTIEVSGVQASQFESMPDQHLEEIHRLKKLVGADLTFHGPIVEPTGIKGPGWTEADREQSERQMWSSLERAHKLDPKKGNIVSTFHSSAIGVEPEVKVFNEKTKKWEVKDVYVVDQRTGDFQRMSLTQDYFTGTSPTPETEITNKNEDAWTRSLQHANFNAYQGQNHVNRIFESLKNSELKDSNGENLADKDLQKLYKMYINGEEDKVLKNVSPQTGKVINNLLQEVTNGDIYLREAYRDMQNLYNEAYEEAKRDNRKEDIQKLDAYRKNVAPILKDLEDPQNVAKLGDEIVNGINVLRKIKTPQRLRPLRPFMIEQSAKSFGNVAFKGYKEFKDTAPVISIENPPAGTGIHRADDLRDMVEESKKVFVERAVSELGMSKDKAKAQADKLIGVTWDVGHVNMLRKYGADEKELLQQTKTIAPYVKHIHLSDNFGMEHTELPMGMGNVPIKKEMEILEKYGKKVKDMKKIAETGNWFGPQGFGNVTPLTQTLAAFGSPIYSMKMSPQWNQYSNSSGGYMSGRGINPSIHHSYFGAGFSNLPTELGGEIAGRSRLSGTPTE